MVWWFQSSIKIQKNYLQDAAGAAAAIHLFLSSHHQASGVGGVMGNWQQQQRRWWRWLWLFAPGIDWGLTLPTLVTLPHRGGRSLTNSPLVCFYNTSRIVVPVLMFPLHPSGFIWKRKGKVIFCPRSGAICQQVLRSLYKGLIFTLSQGKFKSRED